MDYNYEQLLEAVRSRARKFPDAADEDFLRYREQSHEDYMTFYPMYAVAGWHGIPDRERVYIAVDYTVWRLSDIEVLQVYLSEPRLLELEPEEPECATSCATYLRSALQFELLQKLDEDFAKTVAEWSAIQEERRQARLEGKK